VSVFKHQEPIEPTPIVAPQAAPKKTRQRKKSTTRSTQIVRNAKPKITGPSGIFLSSNAQSVSYSTPRTLTAAAVQIKINDKGEFEQFKQRRSAGSSAWQSEAWEYYDAIGEIKYAFNLVASVVSRIRIYAAAVDNAAEAPAPVALSNTIDPRLAAAAERAN
jgi:hypothetical protein